MSAKDLDFLSNYVNSPTVGLSGRATLVAKDFDLSSLGNKQSSSTTTNKDPLLPITPPSPHLTATINGPSLKSCLKQSIKKGRKSVVFGSPNGVEFSADEPTDSLTPLPKFRLQTVSVREEEKEAEMEKLDEQSLKNSQYLNQFEEEEEEEEKKSASQIQKRRKSSIFSKQKLAKVQEEETDEDGENKEDKTMTALNLNDILSQNFTSKVCLNLSFQINSLMKHSL